jgi:hypothetical protein
MLENLTVTVLLCRRFWTDTIPNGRWQVLSLGYICPPFCWISWHRMAVRRSTKWLKHLVLPLYIQAFCDVTQCHSVNDHRRLAGKNTHWNVRNYFVSQYTYRRLETCSVIVSTCKTVWQQYSDSYRQFLAGVRCVCMSGRGILRRISAIERNSKRYFCFWLVTVTLCTYYGVEGSYRRPQQHIISQNFPVLSHTPQ